jgi:hypothetical protein
MGTCSLRTICHEAPTGGCQIAVGGETGAVSLPVGAGETAESEAEAVAEAEAETEAETEGETEAEAESASEDADAEAECDPLRVHIPTGMPTAKGRMKTRRNPRMTIFFHNGQRCRFVVFDSRSDSVR